MRKKFVVGAVVAKLSAEKLFIFSVKSLAIFVESRLKPENLHFLLFSFSLFFCRNRRHHYIILLIFDLTLCVWYWSSLVVFGVDEEESETMTIEEELIPYVLIRN